MSFHDGKAITAEWQEFDDGAFLARVGGFVIRRHEGRTEFGLQVGTQHLNRNKVVHGGVVASMLDHMIGWNAREAIGKAGLVTSNLNVSYLRAIKADSFVLGRVEVRKTGATAAYADGLLEVEGKAVATAQGVFLLSRSVTQGARQSKISDEEDEK